MADKKMKMQELEVPDQYGGKRMVKFYGDQTEEQARKSWAKHLERQEARRKRSRESPEGTRTVKTSGKV